MAREFCDGIDPKIVGVSHPNPPTKISGLIAYSSPNYCNHNLLGWRAITENWS